MIWVSIFALATTVLLLLVMQPIAQKLKLLANPGEHRLHEVPTPLTGGISIFLSLMVTIYLFSLVIPQGVVLGMTLVLIFGIIDDRWTVPFWIRLLVQISAATLLVNNGIILNDLGNLTSESIFTLGRWDKALTIFSIVGVINALNMIDGMDGLVGLIIFVALSSMAYLIPAGQNPNEIMICLAVLGCLAGFLTLNVRIPGNKPVKVFMGDAGSMFLGVLVAWLAIEYSQKPTDYFAPVVALWILIVPLFDTVGVMIRRIIRGRSPFNADNLHTHHLLMAIGFSVNQVLAIIIGTAIVFGLAGVFAFKSGIADHTLFFVFLGLFAVYITGMEIGQRVVQK